MSANAKGKQGTKGAKQIVEENKSTIVFYRNMALGAVGISVALNMILFEITTFGILMIVLCVAILFASYQFMVFMSKAKFSESGALLDSGNDLNMTGGIAENVKDLIILFSGTLLLSLMSNYFWLLLLFAPLRAGWMLWGSVIKPWLSSNNDSEEQEVDEKKKKKMERRMKRTQR